MRPLFFEKGADKEFSTNNKTYLWGNDLLVSPVVEQGIAKQNVTFPKGSNWFNFYTNEKVVGGQRGECHHARGTDQPQLHERRMYQGLHKVREGI